MPCCILRKSSNLALSYSTACCCMRGRACCRVKFAISSFISSRTSNTFLKKMMAHELSLVNFHFIRFFCSVNIKKLPTCTNLLIVIKPICSYLYSGTTSFICFNSAIFSSLAGAHNLDIMSITNSEYLGKSSAPCSACCSMSSASNTSLIRVFTELC